MLARVEGSPALPGLLPVCGKPVIVGSMAANSLRTVAC